MPPEGLNGTDSAEGQLGQSWAADLAPHIDRLALCVHRPTGARSDLREVIAPLGLPPQSFVVSAARMVASGRITVDDLALLGRYQPRRWAQASMDQHLERGVVGPSSDGVAFVPTEEFRSASARILVFQAEEAARLWGSRGSTLQETLDLAHSCVSIAAASADQLPAFRRQVDTQGAVPAGTAGQLLGRLTELRYLRSDVHAAAWEEFGLAGPAAQALHRLWRGFAPGDAPPRALTALEERGLARSEGGQWTATGEARTVCHRVEADTNIRFAGLLAALPAGDRIRLMRLLSTLEGDDPRPAEDR